MNFCPLVYKLNKRSLPSIITIVSSQSLIRSKQHSNRTNSLILNKYFFALNLINKFELELGQYDYKMKNIFFLMMKT